MPGFDSKLCMLSLLALVLQPAVAGASERGSNDQHVAGRLPSLAAANASPASPGVPALSPAPATRSVRYVWRINHNDKISDAFRAWARQSRKWQVVWEAPELVSQATVDIGGDFEEAIIKVIEALNRGDAQLIARFYVDSANSVVRIMEKK